MRCDFVCALCVIQCGINKLYVYILVDGAMFIALSMFALSGAGIRKILDLFMF